MTLPTGTVTFLFTDIEGSTKLAQQYPESMPAVQARHNEILTCAIETYNGFIFQVVGDSFAAAFHNACDALNAALQAQHNLQHEAWSPAPIKVRMGIHTGAAQLHIDSKDNKYSGYAALALTQRIMSAGHGGQILLSNATENLLQGQLPNDISLRDMGAHKFKDVLQDTRVFQVLAPDLQSDFPALRALDIFPNNLPTQITAFIGREKEIAEIDKALADHRLITITGSGGTGKTRLAIEVGAAQIAKAQTDQRFINGVYFIALAPLETTESIVPTVASALRFSFYEGGEPRQQLLDYLREKSMLLIMDNFEHLLSGVDLVTEILNTAPQIKVIATSRARLNIHGEQLFHLGGMDFPVWETPADALDYDAIKLFLQSANRIQLNFELTPDNLKFITRICRLVEGMPLGILLASSWLEMLAPEEIAGEIEKSLDFLETQQRDVPERQHSMRAVFDYSWKLLTPSEQNVFMKASVFRGGFTREAAQQVTGASLRDLMGLVDKSLLQRNLSGRYGIHELLRQYGAEKLSNVPEELEAVRNQHSAYFAGYLHQRESVLLGKEQKQALIDIATEIENIRAAWDWATLQGRVEDINNALGSLAEYHDMRSEFTDAELMMSIAAERLTKHLVKNQDNFTKLLLARIQMRYGDLISSLGYLYKGRELIRTSLAVFDICDSQKDKAYALYFLGQSTYKWKETRAYYEQALTIFKNIGDRRGEALCLGGLSEVAISTSGFEKNIQLCQESLKIFQELGNDRWIATLLDWLGYAYWLVGDYETAKTYHQKSPAIHKEIGNRRAEANALNLLAIDLAGLHDFEQGLQLLQETLAINREIGSAIYINVTLTNLAEVFNYKGDFLSAASYARESFLYAYNHLEWLSWPNRTLGEAMVGLGDLPNARGYLRQSLEISQTFQEKWDELLGIKAISAYFAAQGDIVKALELITLINHHPASWKWTKDRASELAVRLELELPPDVVAQAKERGRARDLDATVAELLDELKE